MPIKIALGQTGLDSAILSDDEQSQAWFDEGFEIGSSGDIGVALTVMQGILAGLEQFCFDNDNAAQGRLPLEEA